METRRSLPQRDMRKKRVTLFVMLQRAVLGVAQTPKDSCIVQKDSLCQNQNMSKTDSTYLSLKNIITFRLMTQVPGIIKQTCGR